MTDMIDVQNQKIENTNENLKTPFVKHALTVQTEASPGVVLFENYEQVKAIIEGGVAYYAEFEYSLDNYQLAIKHRNELKHVKSALEKTKREIVKSYNEPLEVVEKRLDELINLIKIPFKKVDSFIKLNQKESKKYEILTFARNVAVLNGLSSHVDEILSSGAFFEPSWLNVSCSTTTWKNAVVEKIQKAVNDICYVLTLPSESVASALANYYQTLSVEKVKEFINSLEKVSALQEVSSVESIAPSIPKAEENPEKVIGKASVFTNAKVLNFVANSINPYTGEIITGIDETLKCKLNEIATYLESLSNH